MSLGQVYSNIPLIGQLTVGDYKRLGLSIGVLVLTYFLSRAASRRLRGFLESAGFQPNISILLARSLWLGTWTLVVVLLLSFIGVALTPLAALIGVIGLAASLSLQQVLQNLVAGVYLLAERPFSIGDTVLVIGPAGLNHEGRVEDIQMRTTHLRSEADELILIPNSAIFAGVVTNRTAVGGQASQVSVTWPRDVDPHQVRDQVVSLLEGLPSVLATPGPELRVDKVGKEDWTANLSFWTGTLSARSDVIWTIARAFPDATVNDSGATA